MDARHVAPLSMPHTSSVPEVQRSSEPADAKESSEHTPSDVGGEQLGSTSVSAVKLYLILLVPCMASICTGYDISVMNYINGMEQYLTYFQLEGQGAGGGVGSTTGLIFAMYPLGTCLTVLVAGPVADRFGRRAAMFYGGLLCVVGASVVTVAKNVAYLQAGRFLLGMSTALLQVGGAIYSNEISPPQWRGRLTGIYAAIAIVSTILSGVVTTVTSHWSSSASWRLPLGLQTIPAAGVLLFSLFIPESPRWLMSVGRKDEARKVLFEYHGNGDGNTPLVVLELRELAQSIKTSATQKSWWNYASLFRTRSDWYRSLLVLLLAFSAQWSGIGLSYFLVVLLANDQISTENLRLILSLVNSIVGAAGALFGAMVSDQVGRRNIWLWGTVCCTISIVISGVCTAASDANLAAANTAIAFLFIFNFFYCATYVPLPQAYVSECLTFDKRANGVAMYTLVASLASLVNTYATPIALAKIQWRLYFVFIGWDVLACVLIFLFAVETSGKTLEELEEIFRVKL